MSNWFLFERRWLLTLLAATTPVSENLPNPNTLPLESYLDELTKVAPPMMRFGLRATVWIFSFLPLFVVGRPSLFHRLSAPTQDLFIQRMGHSRLYLLRQMAVLLKTVGCFVYFRDPTVQAIYND